MRRFLLVACATALLTPFLPVRAQVPGGGPANTDCYIEWSGITPNKGKNLDCQDGDSSCDVDGVRNNVCVLGIGVCLEQTNVPGCPKNPPQPVQKASVKVSPKTLKIGGLKVPTPVPVVPALPTTGPVCGTQSIFRLPLKVNDKGKLKPSQQVTLTSMAMVSAKPKKDKDVLKVRCVPNAGGGQCPANPAGGPRELQLLAASSGTDLDNGWTGSSQNFPVVSNSELRVCLTGCGATSNPQCTEDEAQTNAVNGATFGSPLPLLAANIPVCVVNRFASTKITGVTANIQTGEMGGTVNLLSDVFLTTTSQVCPRCSGSDVGQVGTCDSGAKQGRACTTEGVVTVANAGGQRYTLSPDCPPGGTPAGTITIGLPLSTGVSVLSGSRPCPGQTQDSAGGCGTCGTLCTGSACVSMTPAGQCVDIKGGISQNCCANNTQTPCFPSGNPNGQIVRTGSAAPPTPPFPDPTYPKTGNVTLVATFCEGTSGATTVDIVTGLPGPGALVLPMAATWMP
ncbi:MAG TPA: hypothetical protein VKH82_11180 [Candidatus Binatia bacterium]|nr:hypothetical protein [Candidatus Binatia bacterium]